MLNSKDWKHYGFTTLISMLWFSRASILQAFRPPWFSSSDQSVKLTRLLKISRFQNSREQEFGRWWGWERKWGGGWGRLCKYNSVHQRISGCIGIPIDVECFIFWPALRIHTAKRGKAFLYLRMKALYSASLRTCGPCSWLSRSHVTPAW